ncbi:nucleoside-diphosphate kinase [Candidatus Woesearchaeota archaeon]|nr:nucleoside-diphosphate kinase [Candidatus Woesearchaeota archaeon]
MLIERTFVAIKPDGVQRSLVGEVLGRFEKAGLKIVAMKMQWIDKDFALKHYTEDIEKRRGKKVRDLLMDYIVEGPVIAMVLEGIHAIEIVRKIVGGTEPKNALPGTIRGDFCHASYDYADKKELAIRNIIHASGNKEDAEYEIKLWFNDNELHSYKNVHDVHIF